MNLFLIFSNSWSIASLLLQMRVTEALKMEH